MAPETFEMEKSLRGTVLLEEWLKNASRDLETHGSFLIQKVESFFDNLPAEYKDLSVKEKISFLRSKISQLPKEILEQAFDSLTSNPVANEAVFSIKDLLNILENKKKINVSRAALREVAKEVQIGQVRLVLFTDGQEAIFIEIAGENFRLDQIFETKLSRDEIQKRVAELGGLVPETKVIFLENNRVAVLNKEVDGVFVTDRHEAIKLAEKIFDKANFIPDLNCQNFLQTNDGRVVYVDRDINLWIVGKGEDDNHTDFVKEKERFLR